MFWLAKVGKKWAKNSLVDHCLVTKLHEKIHKLTGSALLAVLLLKHFHD